MTSLLLDLSGKNPRYLLVDGERQLRRGTVAQPVTAPGDLDRLLTEISRETGERIDRAHLVVPDRLVTSSSYTLQEMPLADAAKIISRRVGATTGDSAPLLILTPLHAVNHQQMFLAEQLGSQELAAHAAACAAARIRLKTVISPLQGLLAALAPLRADMLQPQAVFNLDGGVVTALFLSATEILYCVRLPLPAGGEESGSEEPERALRRKLFDILNLLHGIYSQYMLDHPHLHMGKAWLCGAEAGISGLTGSLADAMDIEVNLLRLLPGETGDEQAFAILAGLAASYDDPLRKNFLAEGAARPSRLRPETVRLVATGMVAAALAGLVLFTENRIGRLTSELAGAERSVKANEAAAAGTEALARDLDTLRQAEGHQAPFYAILKELATKLPDRVLLDSLRYSTGKGGETLELVLVTDMMPDGEQAPVFSAITAMLDSNPILAKYADPAIAIIREGDRRLTQISVTCTLAPPAGAKR